MPGGSGDLTPALNALLEERRDLTDAEAGAALDALMSGEAEPLQAAALLTALRSKGETVDEVVGLARAMREHALPVDLADLPRLADTAGTGGDGQPHVQREHRRGVRARWLRRSGRQARQSRDVVELRLGRCAGGVGRPASAWDPRRSRPASAMSALASSSRRHFIRRCGTSRRFDAASAFVRCSTCWVR